jgi:hypothetical protein
MAMPMQSKGACSNVGAGKGPSSTVRKADPRNGYGKTGQYKRGKR